MTSVPQQQPSPSKFVELSENECIKLRIRRRNGP
jgi:hypothetical protein